MLTLYWYEQPCWNLNNQLVVNTPSLPAYVFQKATPRALGEQA